MGLISRVSSRTYRKKMLQLLLRRTLSTTSKIHQSPKGLPPTHEYDQYIRPRPPKRVTPTENTTVKSHINHSLSTSHSSLKFAIVKIGARQYKVTEGDLVRVTDLPLDRSISKIAQYNVGTWLNAKIGSVVELEKVMLVGSGDWSLVGRPVVSEAKVKAVVVEHTRGHAQVQTPWTLGVTRAKTSRV